MKIKKIRLENNLFFGDAEFVFTNTNGDIMDNVVFAGENGCGKTQLLEIIYHFSTLSTAGEVSSEKRVFTVILSSDELTQISRNVGNQGSFSSATGEMEITLDFTKQPNYWSRINVEYLSMSEDGTMQTNYIDSSVFFSSLNVKCLFRSIYSTVEINYNPKPATNITSQEVDTQVETSMLSDADLATKIQQLLIDLDTNDALDLKQWVSEHSGEIPPMTVSDKRISRFRNAFSSVFGNLNYDRIESDGENRKVMFKKDSANVEISALSSGEKQIVFRGAFLLQNQQSLKGAVVLIDEPEISLHPVWQLKIFDYYRNLFVDTRGKPTSQIFMATHSQYVLGTALENRSSTLIFLLRNNAGSIESKSITAPLVLPSVTAAELNYVAFDIVSNDYHIELYGHLQNKIALSRGISECSVKTCDDYILHSVDYDVSKHYKPSLHIKTRYDTLPTYIRNAIDHPDPARTFTQAELRTSIELLIKLCYTAKQPN